MEPVREEHESYGMVGFSRITHGGALRGGTNLFGSSLKHPHTIALRIKKAVKERHLSTDHYYGGDTLIEVEMSPAQFAEAITSLNVGDGVPCTIRRIGKTGAEECPEVSMRQIFEQEFENSCIETSDVARNLIKKAEAILSQSVIKASERKELLEYLYKINIELRSNLPFIGTQFNEAMDKVVSDAKQSVEAFTVQRITDLGIKALKASPPQQPPTIEIGCDS